MNRLHMQPLTTCGKCGAGAEIWRRDGTKDSWRDLPRGWGVLTISRYAKTSDQWRPEGLSTELCPACTNNVVATLPPLERLARP